MNKKVLVLAGPTAVGKTELSLKLAEKLSKDIAGRNERNKSSLN